MNNELINFLDRKGVSPADKVARLCEALKEQLAVLKETEEFLVTPINVHLKKILEAIYDTWTAVGIIEGVQETYKDEAIAYQIWDMHTLEVTLRSLNIDPQALSDADKLSLLKSAGQNTYDDDAFRDAVLSDIEGDYPHLLEESPTRETHDLQSLHIQDDDN